jgi:NAD(P)-dependent dehydrogenase (short-subunit alcohol dehydrogenase family)
VITGGTGALGRAVVEAFVRAGARVHVPWFDAVEAEELRAGLRMRFGEEGDGGGGRIRLREADLTEESSVAAFFESVRESDGGTEILLNLAGGFAMSTLDQTKLAAWDDMFARNATSAFLCCRASAPGMRARGWGRIVNVVAMPALKRGAANMSGYAAAKAAVLNLTYSLAAELGPDGITVNAIVPTTIDTPANRSSMPEADTSRWLAPAEIARVLLFLASDDAAIVTGSAVALEAFNRPPGRG